jgi:hypothetical protein
LDARLVPSAFVAVTLNAYAVPFFSPVNVQVVAREPPPPHCGDRATVGVDLTVYPVIGDPLSNGAE